MDLPDNPRSRRLFAFKDQLNSLTEEQARRVFEGEEGEKLTERNCEVLDLLATNLGHKDVAELLGISAIRVGQHKAEVKRRIKAATDLDLRYKEEPIWAYIALRSRLSKPLYATKQLSGVSDLLEELPTDLPAPEILEKFTSPEFQEALEAQAFLLTEINAGGLRAVRARLGRWLPFVMILGIFVGSAFLLGLAMLVTIGADVVVERLLS